MSPIDQLKVLKRALQRIGESHSHHGAVARLALMDATGVHPWGERDREAAKFNMGHDCSISAEQRLERFEKEMWEHRLSFAESKPIKSEENARNRGRSAEAILGDLVMRVLGWKDREDRKHGT